MCGADLADCLWGQLAVYMGRGKYLVPSGFHRAGFMNGNVPGIRCDDRFPRPEKGGNGGKIRLGAPDQKMYVRLWAGKAGANGLRRLLAVAVLAVTGGGFQIGAQQRVQNRRMRALGVVVSEGNH